MSDIAVTWAKAQECVDAKGCRDRNAKQTLVHLASYVDAAGEGWAAVGVLALEMDVSERSVQRGLAKLKALGLIKDTGRSKIYEKRVFPIYQLPLDTGHANTMRRIKAEREGARGDAGVTPRLGSGVTVVSPQDVASVTPTGDTGVTQIGKENTQGLKPFGGARACKAACEAWAEKAPERVAARHVERAWLTAVERSGISADQLLGAVLAAVARDPDFGRGKAMNLDRWLDEGRFEAWLSIAEPTMAAASSVWAGPQGVAVAVAGAMGSAAIAAYLGQAQWDDGRQAVITATSIGAQRLSAGAGQALKAIGVTVESGGQGSVRHG
jgi:hypothetical protein